MLAFCQHVIKKMFPYFQFIVIILSGVDDIYNMEKTIGQRIRDRRIELNMSQDELAKKVGYKSRSSINKLETSRNLPLKKVQSVAKALDVMPSYLMGWTDETPSEIEPAKEATKCTDCNEEERKVIKAYRSSNETMKQAICDMLHVERTTEQDLLRKRA